MRQQCLGLQSCTWTNPKMSGAISLWTDQTRVNSSYQLPSMMVESWWFDKTDGRSPKYEYIDILLTQPQSSTQLNVTWGEWHIYTHIYLNFDASVSTNLSWTFHFDSYILIFSLRTINWMSPTTQTPLLEVRQLKSPAHTPQWCSSRWPLFSHQHYCSLKVSCFCRLWGLSLNIFIWRTDRTLFNLGICPTAAATFFFN